ncbi:hypothetical protein HDU98_007170 [Podochytrium sp. JEL0797]|nr:hypothetical protein HDU98_007170 [Podochytrium sp. JEL0797]
MNTILSLLVFALQSLAVSIYLPPANSVFLPDSTITTQYHVSNALSSGSKDIYIYLEPNHTLIHELHRPFPPSLSDTFNFTAPGSTGSYLLAFYDLQVAGVRSWPFVEVESVSFEVVETLPSSTTTGRETPTPSDGKKWSPSRPQNEMLLYREVESKATPTTTTQPSKELSTRFINMALRGNTRFVPNGLAKRAIRVTASNGSQYRVINYFHPVQVERFYENARIEVVAAGSVESIEWKVPSLSGEFNQYADVIQRVEKHPKQKRVYQYQDIHSSSSTPSPPQQKRRIISHHHSGETPIAKHLPTNLLTPPFTASDTCLFLKGENALHPMFQVPEAPQPKECSCGGLGVRKACDCFWNDPLWMDRACWLAPLRNLPLAVSANK